jgi:general secretion pathway protein A
MTTSVEFSEESIKAIQEFSCGTPRLINMICDRALLAGFTSETRNIDKNILNKCLEELNSYAVGGAIEHNI